MKRTTRQPDPLRTPDRSFDLREVVDTEGITVELLVEGERMFSGHVRHVDLTDMFRMLRLEREDVLAQVGTELVARFEQARARIDLSPPVVASNTGEDDTDRLVSRYVTDGAAGAETGIAWYDISSRSVGPDHLPVLVRSRMRDAAHRKLTEVRPTALRVLLGVLEDLAS